MSLSPRPGWVRGAGHGIVPQRDQTRDRKQPKNTEQTKVHRPLASIIYPPCERFPGNCRFWWRKTASGSRKSASSNDSPLHQPGGLSAQPSCRDVAKVA